MKYILLTLSFITVGIISFAQDIQENYDRLGLTVMFLTYGNKNTSQIREATKQVPLHDKFYNNNLTTKIISLPRKAEKKEKFLSTDDENLRIDKIKNYFNENNIGRRIVSKWYNYQPSKGFDLSALFKRAEYNATDEEIYVSETSKRGKARIRDYGHKLVSNSYVAVIDLRDVEKDVNRDGDYANINYIASTGLYLFKLKFGDDEINKLFTAWPYEDDPEDIKKKKLTFYKKTEFPVEFVYAKPNSSHITGKAKYGMLDDLSGKKLDMKKLNKKAFTEMIADSYDKMLFQASKNLESFKVKKKIMKVRPIQAKIGKKESLKTDDKYFVYEYVWNEKQEKAVPKRKAVVRVKRVADNRFKKRSEQSSFYQIYGGTIKEGMIIREKPDWGISLIAGYETTGLGGVNFKGKWRIGKNIGIPAFYLTGNIAFSKADYSGINKDDFTYLNSFENDKVSFYRLDFGLGKGFQFARIFEITPFIAVGLNNTEDNKNEYDYSSFYYKTGLAAGINLLHNVQLYGQLNYYGLGEVIVSDEDGDVVEDMGGEKWADEFPEQEGGTGIEFGLRYEF